MGMSVIAERAEHVLTEGAPELYTAAEAEEELSNWVSDEATDGPYVLAIGGGSGGYFGLHGTLDGIEAVLVRALKQVQEARED